MKNYLLVGEENPNSPSMFTHIKVFLDQIEKVSYLERGKKNYSCELYPACGRSDLFRLSGFTSPEFGEIFYILKKGGNEKAENKSVADTLYYVLDPSVDVTKIRSEDLKNEDVRFVVEENSTPFDRSGDQIEQRIAKFHRAKRIFPNAKFALLIEMPKKTVYRDRNGTLKEGIHDNTKLGISNEMSCRKLTTLGVQIYSSYSAEDTYRKLSFSLISREELVSKCRNLKALDDGNMEMYIDLSNGGQASVCSDPMVSTVISTGDMLVETGFDKTKTLFIRGHNLPESKFKEDNKLSSSLRDFANYFRIYVENYGWITPRQPKANDKIYYQDVDKKTEKAGTIIFESELRKIDPEQKRYKVLFTNHAGCGTTPFDTGKHLRELPIKKPYSLIPGKSDIEEVLWLPYRIAKPDMVVYDMLLNIIYVIEGESLRNMDVGVKQIKSEKFQHACEWIHQFYPTATLETHLVTHGETISKYVLFSVDINGNTSLEWDAEPISVRGPI